jgi:hypothetical protein
MLELFSSKAARICVASLYDSLASFVPTFVKPATPSTEIRGHAVFKSIGTHGSVLVFRIETRPVVGDEFCLVECKSSIGEKDDFEQFLRTLVSKIDLAVK